MAEIEIICNSPDYLIVKATNKIPDLIKPEDVRWEKFHVDLKNCICGNKLPKLDCYILQFKNHGNKYIYLAQCQHCNTIWWR